MNAGVRERPGRCEFLAYINNNYITIFLHSLLEEESQKREELERLRHEQEELLRQERQEREGLEGVREKQESLLREAQDRLQQLEVERQAANAELQVGGARCGIGRCSDVLYDKCIHYLYA